MGVPHRHSVAHPRLFSALAAASLLAGCSAHLIEQNHQRQVTELSIVHVDAAAQPPTPAELASRFGEPAVLEVADLRLHAYALDFDQLRSMHAETRKATERARSAAEQARKPATKEDKADQQTAAAVAVVTAPFWVPLALISLPIAGVDYAAGSAIASAGDDRATRLAGHSALFAYGPDGGYRWHACCPPPDREEPGAPRLEALPNPNSGYAISERILPEPYRVDALVIRCHRAKAGDRFAQHDFFFDFDKHSLDPTPAYFWARVLLDNPEFKYRQRIDEFIASLPAEALRPADSHYKATPLETVDCRATAEQLVRAIDAAPLSVKGGN